MAEIKTLVLEKMTEEDPSIKKEIDHSVTKLILLEKDSVNFLLPRKFKHSYYEFNDLQYNLYLSRVKEEAEKDKLRVNREKQEVEQELARRKEAQEGTSSFIS